MTDEQPPLEEQQPPLEELLELHLGLDNSEFGHMHTSRQIHLLRDGVNALLRAEIARHPEVAAGRANAESQLNLFEGITPGPGGT